MNNILLLCLLVFFSLACVTAQSDNQNSNLPTPVAKLASPSAPTPTPNPNLSEEALAKLANRTATKLDFSKMVKTNLGRQPRTIIKMFAFWEYNTVLPKNFMTYANRTDVYLVERDLNNDGISERIVYELPTDTANGKSPTLAIFRLEKKRWKVLFAQSGDITTDKYAFGKIPTSIEFLSSGMAGDFDIIKVTEKNPTNEPGEINKRVTHHEWVKDGFDGIVGLEVEPNMEEVYSADSYEQFGFESYLCQTSAEDKINEAIPCVDSSK